MIDTDKYEGHTPGPWCWEEKRNIEITTMADGYEVAEVPRGNDADAHLITDAPLLLQEVKRLREDNELYLTCIHASHFRDKPGSAMSKLNQMRFLQRGEEE